MNPKIQKFRTEYAKNKSKIAILQAKNRELERKILELENTDIIGMVRDHGMSMEQFAEFFQKMQQSHFVEPEVQHAEES